MDSEFCRLLGIEVEKSGNIHHVELSSLNRPFPSSLMPLFQNESKCDTVHMKMGSACSFIFMQIKVIFALTLGLKQRHNGTRKWPVV